MNKKHLLIVLCGVLALSLAYAVWRAPRQERVGQASGGEVQAKKRPPTARKEAVKTAAVADHDLRVRLDLLDRRGNGIVRVRRDLFAPLRGGGAPEIVAAPPPLPPPPTPVVAPPPVQTPPPPPPPAPAPRVRFEFLGFLQKEVERTIFLSAAGEIFVVKKGDRFGRDHQFQVVELTAERLTIQEKAQPQPITIAIADAASSAGPATDNRAPRPLEPLPRTVFRVPEPAEESYQEPAPETNVARNTEEPAAGSEGILRPLPRSDFNNIFSENKGPATSTPVRPQPATPAIAPEEDLQ